MRAKTAPSQAPRTAPWAAALLLIFAAQAVWHAVNASATYDEPGHLAASALLVETQRNDSDPGHPRLMRYLFGWTADLAGPAIPTDVPLPLPASDTPLSAQSVGALHRYAAHFLYANRVPADRLLLHARLANIAVAILLGYWVFLWSSHAYGPRGGWLSLFLFAFCPNMIAHGSLVTTDLGGVAFAVGFLYAWVLLEERPGPARAAWAGALLGAAFCSKYSNVVLGPLFLAGHVFLGWANGRPWRDVARTTAWTLAATWATVSALYGFQGLWNHGLGVEDWQKLGWGPVPRMLYRWFPLPDEFLRGLLSVALHDQRGHGAFLMGRYSSTGWWYYFPLAFLLKTPTIIVLLLAAWTLLALRDIVQFVKAPTRKISATMVIALSTLALFLGGAMHSGLNIGLRHILIAYPLLYVLMGSLSRFVPEKPGFKIWIPAALLAAEVGWAAPHHLAFFNAACGGPARGIEYLSDSNLDWGQDLKNLAKLWEKEGRPELVLCYFGTGVPQAYGMTYQSLPNVWSYPGSNHVNSTQPAREWLAVSATNLQGTYFAKHDLFGWLKDRSPAFMAGRSIYVYDITNDLESNQKLMDIYRLSGDEPRARRQSARVLALSGKL